MKIVKAGVCQAAPCGRSLRSLSTSCLFEAIERRALHFLLFVFFLPVYMWVLIPVCFGARTLCHSVCAKSLKYQHSVFAASAGL